MQARRSWAAIVVGIVVSLIGAVLAIGGIWLMILGGSFYYVLTGIAMVAAGVVARSMRSSSPRPA